MRNKIGGKMEKLELNKELVIHYIQLTTKAFEKALLEIPDTNEKN